MICVVFVVPLLFAFDIYYQTKPLLKSQFSNSTTLAYKNTSLPAKLRSKLTNTTIGNILYDTNSSCIY